MLNYKATDDSMECGDWSPLWDPWKCLTGCGVALQKSKSCDESQHSKGPLNYPVPKEVVPAAVGACFVETCQQETAEKDIEAGRVRPLEDAFSPTGT